MVVRSCLRKKLRLPDTVVNLLQSHFCSNLGVSKISPDQQKKKCKEYALKPHCRTSLLGYLLQASLFLLLKLFKKVCAYLALPSTADLLYNNVARPLEVCTERWGPELWQLCYPLVMHRNLPAVFSSVKWVYLVEL